MSDVSREKMLEAINGLIEYWGEDEKMKPVMEAIRALIESSGPGAGPFRKGGDITNAPVGPSPAPSMSIDEALRQMENATEDAIDHKFYSHGEPERYRAALAVLREATKPKVVSKEDFDEWAYELRGWMDTDGIKTILRNHLRELGIAIADDSEEKGAGE